MGAKVTESRRHHPYESFAVGAQGSDLDVGTQVGVAAADPRRVEVGVHAAEPFDQPCEALRSVVAVDIQRFNLDLRGGLGPEGVEGFLTASRRSDAPSGADAEPCNFEPDARCGAHDDDTFHSWHCTHSMPTRRSRSNPSSER